MWHYVDGAFHEDDDAKVPVGDRGFLYGDGCWESVGVWEGRLIHLDEHVTRLYRSVLMLGLDFETPPATLRELIVHAAARNGLASVAGGVVRTIVTRGSGGPIGLGQEVGAPTLVILTMLRGDGAPRPWRGGERVLHAVLSSYTRPPATTFEPRIKSLSYLTSALAEREAHARGADLAILRNTLGFVAEGHAMNVFCVRDGELHVPAESDGGLAGVTRGHVIATARSLGYSCHERSLTAYDFRCADEVFITSASAGIHSVGVIEGRAFAVPAPGPVTSALRTAYVEAAYGAGTPVPASVT